MTFLYKNIKPILLVFLISISSSCSDNEAEYTGILDHRPEAKDGTWVIDGKSFSVTDKVDLDEDHGPITAGACVELEMEDGEVTEIESEDIGKCLTSQQ